jgi:hypothetical protein
VATGKATHVGLVATNSIRGGANRRVLEPIAQAAAISTAWSDEPWVLNGAAVRVSLVCWGRERSQAPVLDGVTVPAIHADLTAGDANLTTARRLAENAGVAFMGDSARHRERRRGSSARLGARCVAAMASSMSVCLGAPAT